MTVNGRVGDERPVLVLGVPQGRASVVTNDVLDAVLHPGADGITIVETSDGGRNETIRGEPLGGPESGVLEPLDVVNHLAVGIVVRGVVHLLVGESVRKMGKGVTVGGGLEPGEEVIGLGALSVPRVGGGERRRPHIGAGAQGLDPVVGDIGNLVVVDRLVGVAGVAGLAHGLDDGTVTVVGELHEEVRTRGETGLEALLPGLDGSQIRGSEAEFTDGGGIVDASGQVNVIDLGVEVGLALARDCTFFHVLAK